MNISRNCCFYPFSYCLPPIRTHPTITKYISNSNIIDAARVSARFFHYYLFGYLTCCSLTHMQADFCNIFCSAEIFSTSLHQGIKAGRFLCIYFAMSAQLLFVFFVLREEFAFLFQTFSRSDPQKKKMSNFFRMLLLKSKLINFLKIGC